MSRQETAIFTNMCMIYTEEGKILVQDRQSKVWPGLTFPGGHVESEESFVEAVIREVLEETGLTIRHPKLCGVKQFQTNDNERYIVLLYKTNEFKGEIRSSDEGEVFWINREDLMNYKLANDFEEMVEVFENDQLSEFYYMKDETNDDWKIKLL